VSVSSDEEENVNDNNGMQHGILAKSDDEWPHFPFIGKPGINVALEKPSNPLEYFELFYIPGIIELIAREIGIPTNVDSKIKITGRKWTRMK
jgi:hypothetical protein